MKYIQFLFLSFTAVEEKEHDQEDSTSHEDSPVGGAGDVGESTAGRLARGGPGCGKPFAATGPGTE